MSQTRQENPLDSSRVFAIVRGWLWLILLLTAVAGASAFIVSQLLPKEYESEAKVLVGSLTETRTDQILAYQQLAQTYVELATTTPVLARVSDSLGLGVDPVDLRARIDVRAPIGQNVIRVVARAPAPDEAARIANAVAEEIITFARTAENEPSLATVVQPALPPEKPSSPRVVLNTVIAAALGFALGVGLALLLTGRHEAAPRRAAGRRSAPANASQATVSASQASAEPAATPPALPPPA